jgi:ring-1,2-phenylacetyl-CoA epoxidase subunit PaaB
MEVYEVFAQPRRGEPFVHVGSLLAAGAELAKVFAKENFARRHEAVALWVVPRAAVLELPEGSFGPALPRPYREGEGYRETVSKRRVLARGRRDGRGA